MLLKPLTAVISLNSLLVIKTVNFAGLCDLLLLIDGDVLTWGKGTRGRLGRQENDEPHSPRPVNIPAEEPFVITSLSCSHWTSLLSTKRKFTYNICLTATLLCN